MGLHFREESSEEGTLGQSADISQTIGAKNRRGDSIVGAD